MKTYTPSKLRENIYRVLDEVVKTGRPVAVQRKGVVIQIVPPKKKKNWFDSLPKRKVIRGDPEALVHIDWSKEWKPCL